MNELFPEYIPNQHCMKDPDISKPTNERTYLQNVGDQHNYKFNLLFKIGILKYICY